MIVAIIRHTYVRFGNNIHIDIRNHYTKLRNMSSIVNYHNQSSSKDIQTLNKKEKKKRKKKKKKRNKKDEDELTAASIANKKHVPVEGDKNDSESDSGSIGVLELGGGSLQVTMQVDAARKIPEKDRFDFKIPNGRSYHVFAHSYLGFGQDYAQTVAMAS